MQAFSIYFPISILMLAGALALTLSNFHWFRQERHAGMRLLAITVLVVLSITFVRMPLYIAGGEYGWESFLHGLVSALQAIGLDADLSEVIEDGVCLIDPLTAAALAEAPFNLRLFSADAQAYATYVIVQYALSLFLCAFAVIKALSRWLLKTLLRVSGQTVFFFSALTEDAILMARSLQESVHKSRKQALFCFLSAQDEMDAALAQCWQEAGLKYALRLGDGLSHKLFPLFASCVNCILCSPEEQANIDALAALLAEGTTARTLRRQRVNYYVFAHSRQAEQAIDVFSAKYVGKDSGARMICMLNPVETLAVHILDQVPLHEYAATDASGKPCLNILIAGSTPLADRFLRNAYSCGQMHDCRLRITLADPDAEAFREQLYASAPLLRQAEHPVIQACGELIFHPLSQRAAIADEALLQDVHYILLAYDDDHENIRAARRIRAIIERQKLVDPLRAKQQIPIVYAVQDAVMNELCAETDPHPAGMPYIPCRMLPVGSRRAQNQTEVLFGHRLLRRALFLQQAYQGSLGKPQTQQEMQRLSAAFVDLMNGAYNRRSSVASALHIRYRDHLLRTLALPPDQLDAVLIHVEHCRWNAYMIMAGYMPPTQAQLEAYFYQGGATHKCEALRLHPCMVPSRPAFTADLWNPAAPAADALDKMSRQVHGMLLQRLRTMNLPIDLSAPTPADKPAILAAAAQLPDGQHRLLAQRMSKALFTYFKQFDLEISRQTETIMALAEDPDIETALRLFWLED